MTEGVDYSSTTNANWTGLATALRAAGKTFAGRYLVPDKSPNGRGITAAEYHALMDAGVSPFYYYEARSSWMLGGYDAGVEAAHTAQAELIASDGPPSVPIHLAHDIEPQRQHLAAIDACFRGAASVLGWERVGGYGGWGLIDYLAQGGNVKWLVQTDAWQWSLDGMDHPRPGAHPASTLYQYNTGTNWIGGANCDLVRAMVPIYGQASAFVSGPPIEPTHPPVEHVPSVPWSETEVGRKNLHGVPALAFYGEATAIRDVPVHVSASKTSPRIATIMTGKTGIVRGSFRTKASRWVLIDCGDKGVGRAAYNAFAEHWPLP